MTGMGTNHESVCDISPGTSNIQALQYVTIPNERAAFDFSCDGCSVAEQAMLRGAVRVCDGSG